LLLRRITKHVNDQNWFAVGIDFCIVVIGVFIGIQVANWNETQALDKEEKRYLQQLSAEYTTMGALLQDQTEDYRRFMIAAGEMISHVQSDEPVAQDALFSSIDGARRGRLPPNSPPTLIELISSGKMDLIENDELRTQLVIVHERTESMGRIFDLTRKTLNDLAAVIQLYVDYNVDVVINEADSFGASIRTARFDDVDLEGMRRDPAIEAAFERYLTSHSNMLRVELRALDEVNKLRAMIDEELRSQP
jgi:septum formation topological specificity factor MinE